eukprot:GHVO01053806.1.p1 GENE.GHVO01053806.1~~GHVO01053806.1.p1  ORF type:complete len:132 (+),score=3.07 GHVO01053806.1:241-636(+)
MFGSVGTWATVAPNSETISRIVKIRLRINFASLRIYRAPFLVIHIGGENPGTTTSFPTLLITTESMKSGVRQFPCHLTLECEDVKQPRLIVKIYNETAYNRCGDGYIYTYSIFHRYNLQRFVQTNPALAES